MSKSKKSEVAKPEMIEGIQVSISHDQKTITSKPVQLETDDMIIIMPKYKPMMFKKKLYWFANILYKFWK